jgi:hypothetical protein
MTSIFWLRFHLGMERDVGKDHSYSFLWAQPARTARYSYVEQQAYKYDHEKEEPTVTEAEYRINSTRVQAWTGFLKD